MNFDTFQFDTRLMAGINAMGYQEPTPIQQQAIPAVLAGHDVLGLAQTGTGKTAAFVLPMLQRLLPGPRGRVRALVVTPTRELAEQIHTHITELGRQTRLHSATVYGGVSMNGQIEKLERGVEIIVACPGRLLDHLNHGHINLGHVEILVIDEADRMFDMGFLPEVRKIIKQVPARRQTLFFSATMPEDVRLLARDVLGDPKRVQVGQTAPATTVSHALYPVASHLKTALLIELLHQTDTESVLIFTRTKHRAKRLDEQLHRAGYLVTSLQGNLSQNRRQAALDGFRTGKHQILVATDIAARGIDVASISHVINYDMPDTAEAYTHRIGRTGRAAKTGDAYTLVTPEDADMVRTIERLLDTKLERRVLPDFNYQQPAPPRSPTGAPNDRGPRNRFGPNTSSASEPSARSPRPPKRKPSATPAFVSRYAADAGSPAPSTGTRPGSKGPKSRRSPFRRR